MPEDKLNTILDVGWQVFEVREGQGFVPEEICYYKFEQNQLLTKSIKAGNFAGFTNIASTSAAVAAFQKILHYHGQTVLLCWSWSHEVELLLNGVFGLDSNWTEMLNGLVGSGAKSLGKGQKEGYQSRAQYPDRKGHKLSQLHPRRASQSPSPTQGWSKQRHRTNNQSKVHVVDLRRLYWAMREVEYETISQVADELRIPIEDGWCAGNECRVLFEIWKSIISGSAIDECRREITCSLELRSNKNIDSTAVNVLPTASTLGSHSTSYGADASSTNSKGLFEEEEEEEEEEETAPPPIPTTGRDPFDEIHKLYNVTESDSD